MGKLLQPEGCIKQRCKCIVWWIKLSGSEKKREVLYTAAGLRQGHERVVVGSGSPLITGALKNVIPVAVEILRATPLNE